MSRVFRSLDKTPKPVSISGSRTSLRLEPKDPEALVREARARSDEILASAREEASRLLSEAREEVSAITKRASEEGYSEGYERGLQDGLRQVSALAEQAQSALENARSAFEQMMREAEPKLVALALEAARRVAAQEIRIDPAVLLEMVRRGMDALRDEREFSLRVDPQLVAIIEGSREQLSREYAVRSMEVVPDPAVKDGVVVGTPHGFVDLTIEAQIRNISEALAEARRRSVETVQ